MRNQPQNKGLDTTSAPPPRSAMRNTMHKDRPRRRLRAWIIACTGVFFFCAGSPPAEAVVIALGDGSKNTTTPADDPGWANVGPVGHLTGVYLGNHWVLTASHVGVQPIRLNGQLYHPVQGELRFGIKTGPKVPADLRLFQVREAPDLPLVKLASAPPRKYQAVIMIGHGRNRQPQQQAWDASWRLTNNPMQAKHFGFQHAAGSALRWGTNRIEKTSIVIPLGNHRSFGFSTYFDMSEPTSSEGQAASGDSGGGVFAKNLQGQWELIGIMTNIRLFPQQPGHISAFKNQTLMVDLYAYREQIERIIQSSPDRDRDGVLDIDDNCTQVANPEQVDRDGDGIGDICQVPTNGAR